MVVVCLLARGDGNAGDGAREIGLAQKVEYRRADAIDCDLAAVEQCRQTGEHGHALHDRSRWRRS